MTHLLLGLDPRYLREEPYIPTVSVPPKLVAGELGLRRQPAGARPLPAVGGQLRRRRHHRRRHLAPGMYATDKLTLFIDIGTNGEMVLGNSGLAALVRLLGRPRLRGRRRRPRHARDRRRHRGRLDRRRHLEPTFRTIDDAPGRGHLRQRPDRPARRALRHRRGRQVGAPRPRGRRRRACACATACPSTSWPGRPRAAPGSDIVLTEVDIDNLLRAKAAIYAGFDGALPQRRRRPRRRGADPHRRRLRPVPQRREGDPHRPAARPAGGALPLPRQHERPGRLHGAALRERRATTSSTSPPR